MENFGEYIDVLVQAPIAVILIFFIYQIIKLITALINRLMNIIDELSKTIKQQERK